MKPTRIRIRMYQVGFGDCFLVSFEYARKLDDGRRVRHMLIDFGSTELADRGPKLHETAQQILDHTDRQLDVLVVTHRHKDHLQGFGDATSGPLTDQLHPKLLLRPWTENPKIGENATEPRNKQQAARFRYARGLRAAQDLASVIDAAVPADTSTRSLLGALGAAARDQVPNPAARARLDTMAKTGKAIYAHYGTDVPLEMLIPGVTCDVLGPPTIDMWPNITKQRSKDPDEFWLAQFNFAASALPAAAVDLIEPRRWNDLTAPDGQGPARWLLENLSSHHHAALRRLVRLVDNAVNNTSLILLLTVAGSRRLLFSGDAQIENWEYVLQLAEHPDHKELRAKLADIDLYKVGHHGSRNATPKTLFNMWNTGRSQRRPMTALMSTKPDVHGETTQTAVPRATLVTALNKRMTLYRTDTADRAPYLEVVGRVTGPAHFEPVEAD